MKGKIEDKEALRAALRAADFKSVRGDFKFGRNQFPVQNYYLQLVGKGGDGRLVHKTIGTVSTNRADAYAQDCKMKSGLKVLRPCSRATCSSSWQALLVLVAGDAAHADRAGQSCRRR